MLPFSVTGVILRILVLAVVLSLGDMTATEALQLPQPSSCGNSFCYGSRSPRARHRGPHASLHWRGPSSSPSSTGFRIVPRRARHSSTTPASSFLEVGGCEYDPSYQSSAIAVASHSAFSRRGFLKTSMLAGGVGTVLLSPASSAEAATSFSVAAGSPPDSQDGDNFKAALDKFGEQLQEQGAAKWPNSISPLPTLKKSALELTMPSSSDDSDSDSTDSSDSDQPSIPSKSDLLDALEQSAQRKRIDPRTHG